MPTRDVATGAANAGVPDGFVPIVHSAPFGKHIGPIFERADDDGFVRAFRAAEKHINAGGYVHGGVLATFADIVLAQAVIRALGRPAVTVRLVTEFLAPVEVGAWVEGTARLSRAGRSLAFVEGEITVGRRTVMTASATFKLRKAGESRL